MNYTPADATVVRNMRKLRYEGEPDRIGRFGHVEKGAVLLLLEREYQYVKDDPDWTLLNAEDYAQRVTVPFPRTATNNLLPGIVWNVKDLESALRRRNKSYLRKVASDMREIGLTGVIEGSDFSRKDIANSIAEHAMVNGWHELSPELVRHLNAEYAEGRQVEGFEFETVSNGGGG